MSVAQEVEYLPDVHQTGFNPSTKEREGERKRGRKGRKKRKKETKERNRKKPGLLWRKG